jgi:hypothetical protein
MIDEAVDDEREASVGLGVDNEVEVPDSGRLFQVDRSSHRSCTPDFSFTSIPYCLALMADPRYIAADAEACAA